MLHMLRSPQVNNIRLIANIGGISARRVAVMESSNVRTVLVVGTGVMGHSIAQVFAQAGIEVDLTDLNEQALMRGIDLIRTN